MRKRPMPLPLTNFIEDSFSANTPNIPLFAQAPDVWTNPALRTKPRPNWIKSMFDYERKNSR
jgi:hypothetical protein